MIVLMVVMFILTAIWLAVVLTLSTLFFVTLFKLFRVLK